MSTQADFYVNPEQRKLLEGLLDQSELEPHRQKMDVTVALVSDEEELANMHHWLED